MLRDSDHYNVTLQQTLEPFLSTVLIISRHRYRSNIRGVSPPSGYRVAALMNRWRLNLGFTLSNTFASVLIWRVVALFTLKTSAAALRCLAVNVPRGMFSITSVNSRTFIAFLTCKRLISQLSLVYLSTGTRQISCFSMGILTITRIGTF